MINFSLKTNVGLVMLLSLLVGCTDRVSLAESEMQKIRSQGPQAMSRHQNPLRLKTLFMLLKVSPTLLCQKAYANVSKSGSRRLL